MSLIPSPSFRYVLRRPCAGLFAGMALLVLTAPLLSAESAGGGGSDQQVVAFFEELQEAFRNKRAPDIMARLHKSFANLITYCTDDSFSVVEHNIASYRTSVGSFFMSDPEVEEFTIRVEHVEHLGKDIAVVARITSSVLLHGIRNTCETFSNYTLREAGDRLLIRNVRGDATCTNSKIDGEQQ